MFRYMRLIATRVASDVYKRQQRYEYLESERPEVFQRFVLKDIASFIGITDVSLSRIRKERMAKK